MDEFILTTVVGAVIALVAFYLGTRGKRGVPAEFLSHRIVRLSLMDGQPQADPDVARLRVGGTLRWVVEKPEAGDNVRVEFTREGGPFSQRTNYPGNPKRGVYVTSEADIDTDPADKEGTFKYTVRWQSTRLGKIVELDPDVMMKGEDH